jgi:hypothetical protein
MSYFILTYIKINVIFLTKNNNKCSFLKYIYSTSHPTKHHVHQICTNSKIQLNFEVRYLFIKRITILRKTNTIVLQSFAGMMHKGGSSSDIMS